LRGSSDPRALKTAFRSRSFPIVLDGKNGASEETVSSGLLSDFAPRQPRFVLRLTNGQNGLSPERKSPFASGHLREPVR
jgi:hypothetical protein